MSPSILDLPAIAGALPGPRRERLERLFEVRASVGRLEVPAVMRPRVESWFGHDRAGSPGSDEAEPDPVERLSAQRLVRVRNRVTGEESLFNPLRSLGARLAASGDDFEARIERTREGCDFCDAERATTADVWGRLRGRHATTAANVAKYDAIHGLVVFDQHHPHRFGEGEVADYLDLARRWIERSAGDGSDLRFPVLAWNCLEPAGASLVHGHLHALVSASPFARPEAIERAAAGYRARIGLDYWDDWIGVHDDLGLVRRRGGVAIVATLTPLKEKEVVLVGPRGSRLDGRFAPELGAALARTLRVLLDRLSVRSFNAAVFPPALADEDPERRVVARCLERGPRPAGGVGAMEMFVAPVVASDPFAVARALGE